MKRLVLYGIVGVCTTLVNIFTYWCSMHIFSNIISTIIAWVIAVIFAFLANKWIVFEQKETKQIWNELWQFLSGRIFTGILELIIMYLAVDVYHFVPIIWKVITNVIVIILNYIFGRMVFVRKENNG